MTWDADAFAETIVSTIKKALLGPLVKTRIDALETRIAAIEAAPSLKFTGVYMDTKQYQPGDCTTRSGALWACTAATTGPFDHGCWTLCVKKGSAQ